MLSVRSRLCHVVMDVIGLKNDTHTKMDAGRVLCRTDSTPLLFVPILRTRLATHEETICPPSVLATKIPSPFSWRHIKSQTRNGKKRRGRRQRVKLLQSESTSNDSARN
jgi:hypothetical protein